jgi:glutamate--cysteine ligase
MIDEDRIQDRYTDVLLSLLRDNSVDGSRTYGFEYEFLPDRILDLNDMDAIYEFLRSMEFSGRDGLFSGCAGMGIAFEPGGQIEFSSIPLYATDHDVFTCQLERIRSVLEGLRNKLGIDYVGTAYVPGRESAPLVLLSRRYRLLHERVGLSGTRGMEMMKGTAAIHLHARVQKPSELIPLFEVMLILSREKDFMLSPERRNIWENTDDNRCGLPFTDVSGFATSRDLLKELVRFALGAVELQSGCPFVDLENVTLDDFLNHMTTIFTDIRLNLKGPSAELRTPDSLPIDRFPDLWHTFVSRVEKHMQDWQDKVTSM